MTDGLKRAWQDLLSLLDIRRTLLENATAFFTAIEEEFAKMDQLAQHFENANTPLSPSASVFDLRSTDLGGTGSTTTVTSTGPTGSATAIGASTPAQLESLIARSRRLVEEHTELRRALEESSTSASKGESLIRCIREAHSQLGTSAPTMQQASTTACYGVERGIDSLNERKRSIEDMWATRQAKLDLAAQLAQMLLDMQMVTVFLYFNT